MRSIPRMIFLHMRRSPEQRPHKYVGKADPEGNPESPVDQGTKLFDRLKEHRKSIRKAAGIESRDFECRYLAVQSGYQAAAERQLIGLFRPLWNNETRIVYGIGKHVGFASC
ncbi:Eco29kI family restriction endonuclease [Neorhizobium galegae]|uniref:Eco29kI family restriction endonuclease n=1 Tax=Neorhizobium galegae TaxID=399 RepID=UPI0009BB3820